MQTIWQKSTFLPQLQFLFLKLTFLHQNWYWQKYLSHCPKVCTTWFYHYNSKFTHLPKNWYFLHRMTIFHKRKQCHQKLTHYKNRRYFLKKKEKKKNVISPLEPIIFGNNKNLLQKWKCYLKVVFLQDFRSSQWSSHKEKK